MIFPMIMKKSKTIWFDNKLTIFDKHVYNCLLHLSVTSAYTVKDLLKIIGADSDENSFYSAIKKLEESSYIFSHHVKDDNGKDAYTCIGDGGFYPSFNINKLRALKFLDSKPLFRNVSFYAVSKRKLIRRQGDFANKYFPISNTGGFNAFKVEENSLLFYFARKNIGKFESPEESLEELKYCGVNVKNFAKFVIENMGKVTLQLSEEAPLTSLRKFLKECAPSTRLAFSIFLEGCVFIAKESYSPEQFNSIISRLSKSKIRMVEKKEIKKSIEIKSNPNIPAKYSSVVDFWNTKNLVKHKNYNKKTVTNACSIMEKMEKGTFDPYDGRRFDMEDFYTAIETFEAMANDPNVKPTGLKQKQFLKKLSLENFLYSNFNGKSKFIDIMDSGSQTLVKPYSEEAFHRLCIAVQKITKEKLTSKNKNHLVIFLNMVKSFFDSNRSKFEYEATVIKICVSVIRSLTKNGKWLNYNYLISEDMKLNKILKVCLEEGFIIGVKKESDSLVYSRVQK